MALGKQTDAFLSELRRGNGVKRMADLIDRKAAIDALHEWEKVYTWDENCLEDREKVYAPSEVIEDLPTAEPKIVRCGQCKYAEVADKEDAQDGYTCQFHRGSVWFSGSYCSWAERRTDE